MSKVLEIVIKKMHILPYSGNMMFLSESEEYVRSESEVKTLKDCELLFLNTIEKMKVMGSGEFSVSYNFIGRKIKNFDEWKSRNPTMIKVNVWNVEK